MAEDLVLALRRRLAPLDLRFAAAFAALALFPALAAGVAAWKVSQLGHGSTSARAWSRWQPHATGFKGAQEIGDHIAPLPKARTSVDVPASAGEDAIAYPLAFRVGAGSSDNRVRAVVVHERGGALRIGDSRTVGFSICGRGTRCALELDSVDGRLLVRREALQAALYAFAYLDFDRVVTLLPPRPGDDHPVTALLFRRSDLEAELRSPLRATIGVRTPTVSELDGSVGDRIERLTAPYLYSVEEIASPADSAPVLALSPLEER